MTDLTTNPGQTHYEGCERELGHHQCALVKLAAAENRLRGAYEELNECAKFEDSSVTQINEVRAQLAAAEAALAACKADTARLDALAAWTKGDQMLCPPGKHGGKETNWLLSREDEARGTRLGQWYHEYEGADLREAIDRARAPLP